MRLIVAAIVSLYLAGSATAQEGTVKFIPLGAGKYFMVPEKAFFEQLQLGCTVLATSDFENYICFGLVATMRTRSSLIMNELASANIHLSHGQKKLHRQSLSTARIHRKKLVRQTDELLRSFPDIRFFVLDVQTYRT